jgi:RNA polymerase sigma-32 factor
MTEDNPEIIEKEAKDQEEPSVAPPVIADPLQRYMWEVSRIPLISREEERELAIRYRETGDIGAAYKLVTSNLRLVVKIAIDFQRYWINSLLDLIQEGNIGLMQAAKKFDPYKGVKFSYYGSFWIKAYILRFIIDNWSLVKVGTTQAQRKLFFRLKREKEKLESLGRELYPKLISERLGVKEAEVVEMDQRLAGREISLEAPLIGDGRGVYGDLIPSQEEAVDQRLAEAEMKEMLHRKLIIFRKGLNKKEQDILDSRLMTENPLTLQDIGEKYGISRERVRQLEVRLRKKLKVFLENELPEAKEYAESFS